MPLIFFSSPNQHYQHIVASRSRRSNSQLSNRTESEEVDVVNDLENEITDFMSGQDLTLPHDTVPADNVVTVSEEQQIIRQMDATADVMDGTADEQPAAATTVTAEDNGGSSTVNEVKDTQLRHRKVANTEDDSKAAMSSTEKYTGTIKKVRPADAEVAETATPQAAAKVAEQELTIKLKYLNDELKIATAMISESIGEFKRFVFYL